MHSWEIPVHFQETESMSSGKIGETKGITTPNNNRLYRMKIGIIHDSRCRRCRRWSVVHIADVVVGRQGRRVGWCRECSQGNVERGVDGLVFLHRQAGSKNGVVLTAISNTFLSVGDDIIITIAVVTIGDDGCSKGTLFRNINIIIIITSSFYKHSTLLRKNIFIRFTVILLFYCAAMITCIHNGSSHNRSHSDPLFFFFFFHCSIPTLISIIIYWKNCKFTYFWIRSDWRGRWIEGRFLVTLLIIHNSWFLHYFINHLTRWTNYITHLRMTFTCLVYILTPFTTIITNQFLTDGSRGERQFLMKDWLG